MATDINTDHSCSRTMEPDMDLGNRLGLEDILALEGSTRHPNQDDSGGLTTKLQKAFQTVSFLVTFDELRPQTSSKTLTTGGPQIQIWSSATAGSGYHH